MELELAQSDSRFAKLPRLESGAPILGGVLLSHKLGSGGMGDVYQGLHLRLSIPVAVKILHDDPSMVSVDFANEARLAAKVNHPNIVRVYDVNCEDKILYIVQEFVEGITAGDLINQKRMVREFIPEAQALEICADAARGLLAIHKQGILHLDIKPANVLIQNTDGLAKLTDFGLGKRYEPNARAAVDQQQQADFILGTPGYISPECINGERPSPASDIYSLGVSMYDLFTNEYMYVGEDSKPDSIFKVQLRGDIPDPQKIRPQLSIASAEIVRKCAQLDPGKRVPDAGTLLDMIIDAHSRLGSRHVLRRNSRMMAKEAQSTVVCVDDDPAIRAFLDDALHQGGHKPVVFDSGNAAVAFLSKNFSDIVLLDLAMPGEDGFKVCSAIRSLQNHQDTPVVFVSGVSNIGVIKLAMEAGACDYLTKPVSVSDLLGRVQCLTRLHRLNRERANLEAEYNSMRQQLDQQTGARNQPQEEPLQSGRKRILLAEDDDAARELLVDFLKDNGFDVTAVPNGMEAVKEASKTVHHLCILDFEMPVMDGARACRRLRSMPITASAPILFLTGLTDTQSIKNAFDAGATDYVTKPIHLQLLLLRINNLMEASESAQESPRMRTLVNMMDTQLMKRPTKERFDPDATPPNIE